jgi:hypothetical protein
MINMSGIDESLKGKRVELVSTSDPYTSLKPGDQGTVEFVIRQDPSTHMEDQVAVKWDNGSNLMLLWGTDSFRFLL